MPPRPTEDINSLPIADIVWIALDRLRPAISASGVTLSADAWRDLSQALATGGRHGAAESVTTALGHIVDSQLDVLRKRFDLDLATALRSDLNEITARTSTAEFLELANAKAEAETQITLGAALLAAAGSHQYACCLLDVAEHDAGDIDAAIARRALLHISGIDGAQIDWLAQVKRWHDAATARKRGA